MLEHSKFGVDKSITEWSAETWEYFDYIILYYISYKIYWKHWYLKMVSNFEFKISPEVKVLSICFAIFLPITAANDGNKT